MKQLSIFDQNDYRNYINTWLELSRERGTSNLTRLALIAQVHATFLSQVLSGGKDLSLEQAALISKHFQHTKLERDYFFTLIQLSRAGNPDLKSYWDEKISELKKEKNKLSQRFEKHQEISAEDRAIFYSSWLYSAIRVSTAINEGQTLSQIAERFNITRDLAETILNFLVKTGLCKNEEGLYQIGENHIHVPNESPFVVKHHTNWRVRSMNKMDQRESDELFFTAPMSISREDFARVREKLNLAVNEIVKIVKASEAEEVVCLTMDFFRSEN